ncbi:hypothetical protein HZS_6030 [Henneguya salminicola]|nr:hypothetical protein HZS_6030 [Henneguya salminicola]
MDLTNSDIEILQNMWDDEKAQTIQYPIDSSHSWHRLTHYITDKTIFRLGLEKSRIYIGPEFDVISSSFERETIAEINLRKQLNKSEADLNISLKFSSIPRIHYPENSAAKDISQHYLDKTFTMENLIESNNLSDAFYGSELLGEFQISFLAYILGGGSFILILT